MPAEKFRFLQGVIAAHTNHTVHGRTRLQKTIPLCGVAQGFSSVSDCLPIMTTPFSFTGHTANPFISISAS